MAFENAACCHGNHQPKPRAGASEEKEILQREKRRRGGGGASRDQVRTAATSFSRRLARMKRRQSKNKLEKRLQMLLLPSEESEGPILWCLKRSPGGTRTSPKITDDAVNMSARQEVAAVK